jgi:pimeloyl-ACP methyl ester carboxylesterase
MDQQIHFCTTLDNVRIAYATVGSGPPLVKAANWLNHLEFDWKSPIWRHFFEALARDQCLIRYDERGNGLSDRQVDNLTFETFVDDLEAVIDAVGLDRFPLLGISQGGPVAIAYTIRHPEKVSHLILLGSYAVGWNRRNYPQKVIDQRRAELTLIRTGWGQENPAFRQIWTTLFFPDAGPEEIRWFNELQRVSASPEMAARLFEELGEIDVLDLLPQLDVPTLVMHCRGDVVVPFEEGRRLASLIRGAQFVPLESNNHVLLKGEPALNTLIEEMGRFLGLQLSSTAETGATLQVKSCPRCSRTNEDPSLNYCLEDGNQLSEISDDHIATRILRSGNSEGIR